MPQQHISIFVGLSTKLPTLVYSFHVGSGCKNPEAFTTALQDSKLLFDYAAMVGLRFTMLDIGGGFQGSIKKSLSIEKVYSMND